jgi:hypothetical protein
MARYYFHIHDGNDLDRDDAGTDLVDFHDVRTEAMSLARDLCYLWNDLPPGALDNMAIEVADEAGQTVLVLPFPVAIGKVG